MRVQFLKKNTLSNTTLMVIIQYLVKMKQMFYNRSVDTLTKLRALSINMAFEAAEDLTSSWQKSQPHDELRQLKERFPVTQAHLPNGKTIPLLKTMQTSVCERDCNYCVFRSGRNTQRVSLSPDELARAVVKLSEANIAQGVFLSSGILDGGIKTQDRIIATAEILRKKYDYRHYIHLKIMPGAEKEQIYRAMQLADRVSINLEGPNEDCLRKLAPHKVFFQELLEPIKIIDTIRNNYSPRLAWKGTWPSSCTQFVVGAVGESDFDLLHTTTQLQSTYHIARAYFSGFSPVPNTPFENRPPLHAYRQHRLYQAFYLLRDYRFSFEEIQFSSSGNLDTEKDPKMVWAEANLSNHPVEINSASYHQLIRIPGIGSITAKNILVNRSFHKIRDLQSLHKLGASAKRAARFILLDGQQPTYQLELFK